MANTFISLNDTPSTFAGSALRFLRVNANEDQLVFAPAELKDLQDLIITGAYAPQGNQVLEYSAALCKWRPVDNNPYVMGDGLGQSGSTISITVSPSGGLTVDSDGLSLANVSNVAGSWGSANTIPVITVDNFGRVVEVVEVVATSSGSNSSISTDNLLGTAGQITVTPDSGNVVLNLVATGVTAATYGSASQIPQITVDTYGRVQNVELIDVSFGGNGNVDINQVTTTAFRDIAVLGMSPAQATVSAEQRHDTLTLVASDGISITTDPSQDRITFGVDLVALADEIALVSLSDVNATGIVDGDTLVWDEDESQFVPRRNGAGAFTTEIPPTGVPNDTLWWDPTLGRMFIFYEGAWVDAAPAGEALPSNANINVDFESVSSNIIPSADSVYDLGSPTNQWRSLYVSNNTIYIGGVALGVTQEGQLTVNGNSVQANANVSNTMSYLTLTNQLVTVPDILLGNVVTFSKAAFDNESVDVISEFVRLTRANTRPLYNEVSESEYNQNVQVSPAGTLWNSDPWGDLKDYQSRVYTDFTTALNHEIGDVILNREMIMWDVQDNKYYTFRFSNWGEGQNGGGSFTYTRRQIIGDPTVFIKTDNGNQVDTVSEGLQITRGSNGHLYNPLVDNSHGDETPTNSLWNNDGWDNLENVQDRTFTTLKSIWDGNFSSISGAEMVMLDTTTNLYWTVKFLSWTSGNAGGGFSYQRRLINLDQIPEGIQFADGTVQKTAYSDTPVKASFGNERRIEEHSDFVTIDLTPVTLANTAIGVTVQPAGQMYDVFVDRTANPQIGLLIQEENNSDDRTRWELDLNGVTYSNDGMHVYETGGYYVIFLGYDQNDQTITASYQAGDAFELRLYIGGEAKRWFRAGGSNLRGAIIDYHAYSQASGTIVGTIHIARDNGNYNISHTETSSGSSNLGYIDLWLRDSNNGNEREIYARRLDGAADTIRIMWTAKFFFSPDSYD